MIMGPYVRKKYVLHFDRYNVALVFFNADDQRPACFIDIGEMAITTRYNVIYTLPTPLASHFSFVLNDCDWMVLLVL